MLLDVRASTEILGGIGESTLRRWIAAGQIPVVRLGRRVLIRRQVLDRLVKESERTKQAVVAGRETT